MRVTIEDIKKMKPCNQYRENNFTLLKKCFGRKKYLTENQIAELDIPGEDRLWALQKLMTDAQLHEAACRYVEELVLPDIAKKYPDFREPHELIAVKRKWMRGEITTKELNAARSAARSAGSAARYAARYADWYAACDAAWYAACDAACDAARYAARSAGSAARSAGSAARSAARSAGSAARSCRQECSN